MFRMDDPSDNQRYYEDGDGHRYLPYDLDFNVEEEAGDKSELGQKIRKYFPSKYKSDIENYS